MKVTDLISGKINLKPLHKEKKGSAESINKISEGIKSNNRDLLSLSKTPAQDLVRLQEMQVSYNKSNTSLHGFNEISSIIQKFEQQADDQKDWNALNQDLKSTVSKTLFKGESVISYLSTNVKDEKALYTLKSTLANEVQSAEARVSQARKQISRYLVKEANKEAAVGFDPQKIVENIQRDLNQQNAALLSGNINNIQRLLNFES